MVSDDGTVDRVRADWWSDELVRDVAATFPAPTAAAPTAESIEDACVARASCTARWAAQATQLTAIPCRCGSRRR